VSEQRFQRPKRNKNRQTVEEQRKRTVEKIPLAH
jgi:hypothetical protein